MMKDAAVEWELGSFEGNEIKYFNLYICANNTLKGCKSLIRESKGIGAKMLFSDTEQYWKDFLEYLKPMKLGINLLDDLYRRSLLVFRLMYDKKSGGLLAAPEVDEYFTKCGRYAYCWGRDAAFITTALDIAGLSQCVDNFYKWAVNVQDEDGSWQQRYHMDGNLGPCWGLQVDETGTLIWGMLNHYNYIKKTEFLQFVWNSVEAAANFFAPSGDSSKDTTGACDNPSLLGPYSACAFFTSLPVNITCFVSSSINSSCAVCPIKSRALCGSWISGS
jgi:GH15 family glucan-1,4-alpha-glucosidase